VTVDENDWHLMVVCVPQLRIEVDVYLTPLKIGFVLDLSQRLFDDVAEMTSLARIDNDVVHTGILSSPETSTTAARPGKVAERLQGRGNLGSQHNFPQMLDVYS
jgi:hypothetical protein